MSDLAEVPDGQLWQRARSGEGECFGVLFDRHGEKVRAYCARRTGSLDAADDLVSIVFLEAWRRRAEVELVHDSALPWLYGVAARTISHRTRTSLRHRRALARLPAALNAPDHADDVVSRLDDQQRLDRLHASFADLSRADQDVLVLCVWQGLDYAAAAVALGVPVGTVRSRLSRARDRWRRAADPPASLVPAPVPRLAPTRLAPTRLVPTSLAPTSRAAAGPTSLSPLSSPSTTTPRSGAR